MQEGIKILAIETSCDDTTAAVIKDGHKILSNVISSQRETHSLYGGVVPEIASREHLKLLIPVVKKSLEEANVSLEELNAIGVTHGPGLVGPLLVGLSYAKSLSYAKNIPLVPQHHIKSHIYANFLDKSIDENYGVPPEFPLIALVVSGGHTDIIYMKNHNEFEIIGRTVDDAAGEAFDKIARALDLGYPGGPKIDKLAKKGLEGRIEFPKAKLKDPTSPYDFSFSGLKSAVLNYLNRCEMKSETVDKKDVAAGFQKSVIDVLVSNTLEAARDKNVNDVVLAGGVSANSALRDEFKEKAKDLGIKVHSPPLILCTDNAAMVGASAYHSYKENKISTALDLNAVPNLEM
ncbi:tRNA (adenosine(37)-N6)-threonylcarbamoyltransferase complex transferase subunit TsaD [Natranaerofaba carboxydovora]|uniref:tRNA (adenosine(37)-N6)-threonylcarbamoyltransferase complex transferase subunit TsaD n=1 Tax=Natranaerofaba carboxydovora TaxID=2742683 RepID=UPI001F1335B3|nr:tRNA (adenosine(37)-N6)-threonylcarbamoyltransferase complex transferase subunit TsaD [Natranaerofaba carboxydovora]UMZ74851.1 tRNA N6-adenosine threonylcarbamoyltransferase [Natranaerofaba carboxydovora]